jgi:hypothetical protein
MIAVDPDVQAGMLAAPFSRTDNPDEHWFAGGAD